jgi:transcription elongation factor Elf1
MPAAKSISQDRAARIARSHACTHCLEYSFKKVTVRRAPVSHQKELKTAWIAVRVCGVCGLEQEMGIDGQGEIVYGG